MPADAVAALLPPRQRRLFEVIQRAGTAGISVDDCMVQLYADDPSGGAEHHSIITVMAYQRINPKIAAFGLKLTCGRGAGHHYRLVRLA